VEVLSSDDDDMTSDWPNKEEADTSNGTEAPHPLLPLAPAVTPRPACDEYSPRREGVSVVAPSISSRGTPPIFTQGANMILTKASHPSLKPLAPLWPLPMVLLLPPPLPLLTPPRVEVIGLSPTGGCLEICETTSFIRSRVMETASWT